MSRLTSSVRALAPALTWLALSMALVHCFSKTKVNVESIVCRNLDDCPSGYDCHNSKCVVNGSEPDARSADVAVGDAGGYAGAGGEAGNGVDGGSGGKAGNVGGIDSAAGGGSGGILDGGGSGVEVGASGGSGGAPGDGPSDTPLPGVDAPVDSPTDVPVGDTLTPKKNGDPCKVNSECPQAFCVGGICCDKACSGLCTSCKLADTNQPDGTCAAVASGRKDPAGGCVVDTANQCGNDGFCDGASACRKVGSDHVCAKAFCAGTAFTPTATCTGTGSCSTPKPDECGAAQCSETGGCQKSCTSDSQCTSSSYCDTASSSCKPKKNDGDACAGGSQCSSTFCVDGVCCHTVCTDKCYSCSATGNGQKSGTCLPAAVDTDPRSECTASGTCGLTGNCSGSGACKYTPATTSCGTSCTGNQRVPMVCDGAGTCGKNATSATTCPGSLNCNSAQTDCLTSCGSDADCVAGYRCSAGSCIAKTRPGATCSTGAECNSSAPYCTDGVCCTVSACGMCQACNLNGIGTCGNKASGAADSNCPANVTTCAAGGCDGSGACKAVAAGTPCGTSSSCTNAAEVQDPATASGMGQLGEPSFVQAKCNGSIGAAACQSTSGTCGGGVCSSSTACMTSCTRDADCAYGYYCSGTCRVAQKGAGASCARDIECASRVCSGGVCRECTSDDDCPRTRPACVNNACVSCQTANLGVGTCSTSGDGSYAGSYHCGSRTRSAWLTSSYKCSCDSSGTGECPVGSLCTSDGVCVIRAGMPCVASSTCNGFITACPSSGICPATSGGYPCMAGDRSTGDGCQVIGTISCRTPSGEMTNRCSSM